jgi:hypothetical protein
LKQNPRPPLQAELYRELEENGKPPLSLLAMNELVEPILRWATGASLAQNSEITLINIGKSLVAEAIL